MHIVDTEPYNPCSPWEARMAACVAMSNAPVMQGVSSKVICGLLGTLGELGFEPLAGKANHWERTFEGLTQSCVITRVPEHLAVKVVYSVWRHGRKAPETQQEAYFVNHGKSSEIALFAIDLHDIFVKQSTARRGLATPLKVVSEETVEA